MRPAYEKRVRKPNPYENKANWRILDRGLVRLDAVCRLIHPLQILGRGSRELGEATLAAEIDPATLIVGKDLLVLKLLPCHRASLLNIFKLHAFGSSLLEVLVSTCLELTYASTAAEIDPLALHISVDG